MSLGSTNTEPGNVFDETVLIPPKPETTPPLLNYDKPLTAMLGPLGNTVLSALGIELSSLDPRSHYLNVARRAAESVILTGSFLPTGLQASPKDIQRGRDLALEAVEEDISGILNDATRRPASALASAAVFYSLTGERCWNDMQGQRMKTDAARSIGAKLEADKPELAAPLAADYRLVFDNPIWTSAVRDQMVSATLRRTYDLLGAANRQSHNPFMQPLTPQISRRIAVIRVLNAHQIIPVRPNTMRGIAIADSPPA